MNVKQFRVKKLLTDFIIFNIVINGVFYIFNFRNHKGPVTFDTIVTDLLIGLFILAVFCPVVGFINIPKALKKEQIDVSTRKISKLNHLFPHNNILRSLLLSLFIILFSYIFFILLPKTLGLNDINHYIGFAFKVLTAIFMSGIVGYVVIELTMDDYQEQKFSIKGALNND